ncbi:MAG: hypothetical protein HYU54_06095 [Actinobacteria bacterium]|nr:hypothetical protein [Actinomycetota bacterium]
MSPREALPQLSRPEAEEIFRRLSVAASRRRRIRGGIRVATTVATALVVAGVLIWATASLTGLRKQATIGGDTEEPPNYRFENVTVGDYVDPRTEEVVSGKIAVEGTLHWTSDTYPGDHRCTVTVYGPDGTIVGSMRGEWSALSEGHRSPVPVDVSGEAASATITCDPTRLDTPVGYQISNVGVTGTFQWQGEPSPSGVEVTFDVAWPVELPDYPSENACDVTLFRPSGQAVATQRFTLAVGPGPTTIRVWYDEFSDPSALNEPDSLIADVQCHPYTAADVPPEDG